MVKLKSLLKGLQTAQESLQLLEGAGIDVNRLIGISNAQGPLARIIHGVMLGSIELTDHELNQALTPIANSRQLPVKSGSSTKKKSK